MTKASLNYPNVFWITLVHLVAISAFWFFSWTNLAALLVGVFVLAPLGINVGYHRLLCHRSFESPRWVRNSLGTLGAILGGGAPVHWVGMHRVHHRHSDTDKDPHNSRKGFWYAHVMHLFHLDEQEKDANYLSKLAPDLMQDPFFAKLNKYWLWLALATLPVLYFIGGIGLVLWGGFLRIVLTWHIMWFVNSASHLYGYRNYETKDHALNCWWVGLLAAGEGWHNNHHARPSCARHGHRWWELDLSYYYILLMEGCGLARNVNRSTGGNGYIPNLKAKKHLPLPVAKKVPELA